MRKLMNSAPLLPEIGMGQQVSNQVVERREGGQGETFTPVPFFRGCGECARGEQLPCCAAIALGSILPTFC